MSQSVPKVFQDMSQSVPRHVPKCPKTCPKVFQDMSQKCPAGVPKVFQNQRSEHDEKIVDSVSGDPKKFQLLINIVRTITRTPTRQKIHLARIAGLLEPHLGRILSEFLGNDLLCRRGRQSRWSPPPIKYFLSDQARCLDRPRYQVYCLTPKTRKDIKFQKTFFFGFRQLSTG